MVLLNSYSWITTFSLLLFVLFYYIWHYWDVAFFKFFSLVASKAIFSTVYCFISFHLWHFHSGSFLSNFSYIYPYIFIHSNMFLYLFSHHLFSLGNIIHTQGSIIGMLKISKSLYPNQSQYSRLLCSIASWLYLSGFSYRNSNSK